MNVDDLNIDARIKTVIKQDGITDLYPIQAKALRPILEGKNVFVSIPTASGKSLLGYIAILNRVLKGGKGLYIVPLRALASEKYDDLIKFSNLGVKVTVTTGDYDQDDSKLKNYDIIIATSERADSIMRHRSSLINDIRVLVADEIHLINERERGPTMEITITRLMKENPQIQVIALSATVSNSEELATWLNAEHIKSDWRPVKLREGVFSENIIYYKDGTRQEIRSIDDEEIVSMCMDCVLNGGQTLVFTNSRNSAERLASKLARYGSKMLSNDEKKNLKQLATDFLKNETETTDMGEELARLISNGVAFHHAGLTSTMRKTIENSFRARLIKVITATPTLAAGVNLPARRVIIHTLYRYDEQLGNAPVPLMEIKQMMGRAGRPKYDTTGDAILIARGDWELKRIFDEYIHSDVPPIESKLASIPVLRTHVLASICTEIAYDKKSLLDFFKLTFFAYKEKIERISEIFDEVLQYLDSNQLIKTGYDGQFEGTLFGKRVSDLYIDPMSGVIFKQALENATVKDYRDFPLLQVISYVPDMPKFYLRRAERDELYELYELEKPSLLINFDEETEQMDYLLMSLKVASMLQYWINEESENTIAMKFGIGPGDIRLKVETADWLLYSMREIAKLFNPPYVTITDKLILRNQKGIKEELISLCTLEGIGRRRARVLFNSGLKTIEDLRDIPIEKLIEIPGIEKKLAKKIKAQVGDVIKGEPYSEVDEPQQSTLEKYK